MNPIASGISLPLQAESSSSLLGTTTPGSSSFSDLFRAAIGNIDGLQASADTNVSGMLQGSGNADVGNVMVSVEKADIAFQLMMQVRNKVVSAYQDLEKMQF